MKNTVQLTLDSMAIGISAVCVLHCVALPLLLAFFPTLIALPFDDHVFHKLLVWLALPASLIAVTLGCWKHKDGLVIIISIAGLFTLIATAMYGHDILGEVGEKIATLIGACILSFAHLRNFFLCRKDSCNHI